MTITIEDFDKLEEDEYWANELDLWHTVKEGPGIVYIEYEQVAEDIARVLKGEILKRETIRTSSSTSSNNFRTYISIKVKNLKEAYQALRFSYIYGKVN